MFHVGEFIVKREDGTPKTQAALSKSDFFLVLEERDFRRLKCAGGKNRGWRANPLPFSRAEENKREAWF